jgi:hypothetical protein
MKKILAILLMLAALLASCEYSNLESSNDNYTIYVDTIRGHEYIIMQSFHNGNIIHSESCPCKKGGNDENP